MGSIGDVFTLFTDFLTGLIGIGTGSLDSVLDGIGGVVDPTP